jgi:predicted glycogen debranching enzyme
MLALRDEKADEIVHVTTNDKSIDHLLECEWLLANERGSYSSSTVIGCNTSSYHGLLIGSLHPPVSRIMALSTCVEELIWQGRVYNLSTFAFPDGITPSGCTHLRQFSRGLGAHFVYEVDGIEIDKAVYLARKSDTVVMEYTFHGIEEPVEWVVRPLVGLRDFHWLGRSDAPLRSRLADSGVAVSRDDLAGWELLMDSLDMAFHDDPQWWFNFTYRANQRRGQPATEDLFAPGSFVGRLERDGRIVFRADLRGHPQGRNPAVVAVDGLKRELTDHLKETVYQAKVRDDVEKTLTLAADQFVVKRGEGNRAGSTIVAGFPWFADWGRDAFIALPGLLLETGRFEEAKSVLCTFAAAADGGMIPNHFDDRAGNAHFNSVDASLWFIHAAFQYLHATADRETFSHLLDTIRWIIDSYHKGTRFGIHADTDGLIIAGDSDTQLTWMDAKYDGVTFTPRWGKAVEVNALWHNALSHVERFYSDKDPALAERYRTMARQVGASFGQVFWNTQRDCLNDTVMGDGWIDSSLRPNQIFAVSLPFGPPLNRARQRAIVDVVERELLTPFGLRTLERSAPSYKARYEGPQSLRDAAYHQGTVWPYLIGPFVEAYLKVHDFSSTARVKASRMIEPLLQHLLGSGCLGSVSEIFDGDEPQLPKGCHAQAWSVAELLRAYRLIHSEDRRS